MKIELYKKRKRDRAEQDTIIEEIYEDVAQILLRGKKTRNRKSEKNVQETEHSIVRRKH